MSHDPALVAKVAKALSPWETLTAPDGIQSLRMKDPWGPDDVARAVLDALDLPGRDRRAKAEERVDVQGRLDDVLGFLSDDGRYGYDQHPHELCGPDHHVCALVSHLMNAVIDPDWLSKLKAARERVSRAAEIDPEEGDDE